MKKIILGSLFVLIVLTACSSSEEAEVIWGYSATNGPDQWAELSPDYQTCGEGVEQSPIDIETSAATTGTDELAINYTSEDFTEFDNGHAIEFSNKTKESQLVYNDVTYNLEQFHIHTPSENEIDGKSYPAELHFVNKDAEGNTLVLSVMVEIGKESIVFGNNLSNPSSDEENENILLLNPNGLIPSYENYYSFTGSLTTPPCTEDVQWVVLDTPITISQDQYDDIQSNYTKNNRPTQELNEREVSIN